MKVPQTKHGNVHVLLCVSLVCVVPCTSWLCGDGLAGEVCALKNTAAAAEVGLKKWHREALRLGRHNHNGGTFPANAGKEFVRNKKQLCHTTYKQISCTGAGVLKGGKLVLSCKMCG